MRRQLGFEPGDVFDPERLAAARRRLERPPAFATVDVGPPRPPPRRSPTSTYLSPSRSPGDSSWASATTPRSASAGISSSRTTTSSGLPGAPASASRGPSVARRSSALDHVDLVYREPWIPGTPWQGQIELYGERTENLGYDLQRVGFRAWIGDDLLNPRGPQNFRSQLRYRLEGARVSNVSSDLQAQGIEPGTDRIGSLTPVVAWDFRDDRFNPHRGQLPPGVPGGGAPRPRRERGVREGRALDELVLLVAAAHRVRGLGTAGAGRAVRRNAEPADRGPLLRGRQHERTRVSREPVGPAGRGRESGRRRRAGSPERWSGAFRSGAGSAARCSSMPAR